MKKYIILFIVMLCFYTFSSSALEKIEIPDDALRIRVIPNSDSEYDQAVKIKVKEELSKELYELLKNAQTSDEAKNIMENNMDAIDKRVKKILLDENFKNGYSINYGYNYFPEKNYKGVVYEEGYYESLVVKIGKGEGENWWCVLYPPLCLIEENDTEYKSLIKDLLDKYL